MHHSKFIVVLLALISMACGSGKPALKSDPIKIVARDSGVYEVVSPFGDGSVVVYREPGPQSIFVVRVGRVNETLSLHVIGGDANMTDSLYTIWSITDSVRVKPRFFLGGNVGIILQFWSGKNHRVCNAMSRLGNTEGFFVECLGLF